MHRLVEAEATTFESSSRELLISLLALLVVFSEGTSFSVTLQASTSTLGF
jgi:hypothetical protein